MRFSVAACVARQWFRGVALVAGTGWLAACSGAHEPAQHSPEGTRVLTEIKPTANVPALLGQSIDKLRRRLGPTQEAPRFLTDPAVVAALAPLALDSLVTFRTGGLVLLASYNIRTRQVGSLLLLGRHEDSLMHRAALRPNSPDYLVLPTFQSNKPGALLGLRVVPVKPD